MVFFWSVTLIIRNVLGMALFMPLFFFIGLVMENDCTIQSDTNKKMGSAQKIDLRLAECRKVKNMQMIVHKQRR